MVTAALVASLAASRDRCFCCDAFVAPSFRSLYTAAPSRPGRLVTYRRRSAAAAAAGDADADADASSDAASAAVDAPEETAVSEGGGLDVENVVIIGRYETGT